MEQELDSHLYKMSRTLRQGHAFVKSLIRGHGKQYSGYAKKELERLKSQIAQAEKMIEAVEKSKGSAKTSGANSMEDLAEIM